MKNRILIIDDEAEVLGLLRMTLEDEGYDVDEATNAEDGMALLEREDFDTVVTDVHMGRTSGIELCAFAKKNRPDVPVVVLTAFGNVDVAVDALRAGAADFLSKPIDIDVLLKSVANQVERRALQQEVRRLKAQLDEVSVAESGLSLLGESPAMLKVRKLLARVARTDTSVLISGESGTGKEVAARLLHDSSPRRDGPFVALNMSSFPETLLEAQLFGHVKGAFTDARTASPGLLVEANGGTLFLDEMGDMPLSLQPKLLRVLQERKVRPVGGQKEVDLDVRVVAATHRDLEKSVAQGTFREDLYFRLNVVQLDLPPLRTRDNDILLLAHHFMREHGSRLGVDTKSLSPEVTRLLLTYPWPGNVRELSNCMERAVALAETDVVHLDDLPDRVVATRTQGDDAGKVQGPPGGGLMRLDEVERAHILHVYKLCKHNKVHTAEVLGIDRKTLYRKLAAFLDDDPNA